MSITRKPIVYRFTVYRGGKVVPGVLHGFSGLGKLRVVPIIVDHLIDRNRGEVLNVSSLFLDLGNEPADWPLLNDTH